MTRAESTSKIREIVGERGVTNFTRNWAFVYPHKIAILGEVCGQLQDAGFTTAQQDKFICKISIELP